MAELIIKSKVKEVTDMQISSDVYEALDKEVEKMIKKAEERAKANNRKTLYARDL
jgi:histone H3/H4